MRSVVVKTIGDEKTFFAPGLGPKEMSYLKLGMQKVLKSATDKAIEEYVKKKKSTPKYPSMIIDSFDYDIKSNGVTSVVGVFFCGGPKAPYAVYVDQPHKLKGGKGKFEGYFFMDAGMKKGEEELTRVIKNL